MKYYFLKVTLLLLFAIVSIQIQSQSTSNEIKHCFIKGHIPSLSGQKIEIDAFGLLDDTIISVSINKNGEFIYNLNYPLLKVIYFNADTSFVFCNTIENDTIQLIEHNNVLSILTSSEKRTNEINQAIGFRNKWNSENRIFISTILRNHGITEDEFVKEMNGFYNQKVKDLLLTDISPASASKIITDLYYSTLSYYSMYRSGLLPRFGLKTIVPDYYKYTSLLNYPEEFGYRKLDTILFQNSLDYRGFIYSYCSNGAFSLFSTPTSSKDINESFEERSFYYTNYLLPNRSIREWVLFSMLKKYLQERKYEEFNNCFIYYCNNTKNKNYINYLTIKHDAIKNIEIGETAPDFTLLDTSGNKISLSNFIGKVVYINFWGVHCGPCIYNIKNYYKAIHEKYKDIVFMNISVEGKESEWKQLIKELNLDGVNLSAPGWENNEVCKLYNIHAIPDYFIINKKGKIEKTIFPETLYTFIKQFPDYDSFKFY